MNKIFGFEVKSQQRKYYIEIEASSFEEARQIFEEEYSYDDYSWNHVISLQEYEQSVEESKRLEKIMQDIIKQGLKNYALELLAIIARNHACFIEEGTDKVYVFPSLDPTFRRKKDDTR